MQRHIRNEEELPIYTAPANPVAPGPCIGARADCYLLGHTGGHLLRG